MPNIDPDKLHEIMQGTIALPILTTYGAEAADPLRGLLSSVKTILSHLDIEHFTGDLVVFRSIRPDAELIPRNRGREVLQLAELVAIQTGPLIIESAADGRYFLWREALDGATISDRAIVFKHCDGSEWVYAKAEPKAVIKLATSFKSMFAIPTFSDLATALERYRVTYIKTSRCKLFNTSWADQNRLFFKIRPEHIMRDSLSHFLGTVLQDADVLAEQNVDDTQPIDIKVTWPRQNSIALIEIKWLGKSRNDAGHVTTTYSDARAKEGAQQLVDYLEAHKPAGADKNNVGYLVVIDGRRRGLADDATQISRQDGLHYENSDITYDPAHLARPDFKPPTRMFAQPVHV